MNSSIPDPLSWRQVDERPSTILCRVGDVVPDQRRTGAKQKPQRTSLVVGIPVLWAFGNPLDRDLGQGKTTSGLSRYFFTQRDRSTLERPKPF